MWAPPSPLRCLVEATILMIRIVLAVRTRLITFMLTFLLLDKGMKRQERKNRNRNLFHFPRWILETIGPKLGIFYVLEDIEGCRVWPRD